MFSLFSQLELGGYNYLLFSVLAIRLASGFRYFPKSGALALALPLLLRTVKNKIQNSDEEKNTDKNKKRYSIVNHLIII
jgi:hypothetical protein